MLEDYKYRNDQLYTTKLNISADKIKPSSIENKLDNIEFSHEHLYKNKRINDDGSKEDAYIHFKQLNKVKDE